MNLGIRHISRRCVCFFDVVCTRFKAVEYYLAVRTGGFSDYLLRCRRVAVQPEGGAGKRCAAFCGFFGYFNAALSGVV